MSASAIYLLIVCLVMGGLFIFGLIASRNIKDAEDWAVAGKGLGIIPLSGTYFATIISATSIVSYLGFYYLNGWSGMWNFAGTLVTSFVACLWAEPSATQFPNILKNALAAHILFLPPL